jgi:hypothetical protein
MISAQHGVDQPRAPVDVDALVLVEAAEPGVYF